MFVNDGAKSDTGNIGDIFSRENSIAVTDPIYPVYIDSNVMAGRAGVLGSDGCWSDITYMPCNEENNFVPSLPGKRTDIIYLCYPNNPTGTTLTRDELKQWVDYALANDSIIFFDAAYEAFIREENVPHSIYEIEGARQCAIEFRSFSKTAGFTGVRCGYTVIPDEVTATAADGTKVQLNKLWLRRQCTKVYKVQWHQLYHTACCRSDLFARGQGTGKSQYRLLSGKRTYNARRLEEIRNDGFWWNKFSVFMAQDS